MSISQSGLIVFLPGVNFSETLLNALSSNVITTDEYTKLVDYNNKREKAIRVDEFDFDMNILDDKVQPLAEVKKAG